MIGDVSIMPQIRMLVIQWINAFPAASGYGGKSTESFLHDAYSDLDETPDDYHSESGATNSSSSIRYDHLSCDVRKIHGDSDTNSDHASARFRLLHRHADLLYPKLFDLMDVMSYKLMVIIQCYNASNPPPSNFFGTNIFPLRYLDTSLRCNNHRY
jgi:hypothetical protein